MDRLMEFQIAARDGGFVAVEECDGGTVLWLRKETPDTATKTHRRICLDSDANIATVYWMTALGKIDSQTFRNVPSLQSWIALHPSE